MEFCETFGLVKGEGVSTQVWALEYEIYFVHKITCKLFQQQMTNRNDLFCFFVLEATLSDIWFSLTL